MPLEGSQLSMLLNTAWELQPTSHHLTTGAAARMEELGVLT